jgi:hypothetical protein
MAFKIIWSQQARDDLRDIVAFTFLSDAIMGRQVWRIFITRRPHVHFDALNIVAFDRFFHRIA